MPIQFYFFLVAFQSIIFLLHWFLYRTVLFFFNITDPGAISALQGVFGILSLSFLAASLLAFRFKHYAVTILYRISATWFGSLYFTGFAAVLIWILYGLAPIPASGGEGLAISLFALSVLLSAWGLIHSSTTRITRVQVALRNLPEFWKGKKILFVSDTHLGHFRGVHFAKKIAKIVNDLRPEMMLIGGDYYDGVQCDFEKLASPLKDLHLPHGMYFATGNHEEFHLTQQFLSALKGAGVTVLYNEKMEIEGLQLAGVDYSETVHRMEYEAILQHLYLDPAKPTILVKHVPNDLDLAERAGIEFQISGHTHLGQIWPLSYITRAVYHGYDYGLKQYRGMQVLTSSGAGTWGPPQRVGTKSEVVLITLEAAT